MNPNNKLVKLNEQEKYEKGGAGFLAAVPTLVLAASAIGQLVSVVAGSIRAAFSPVGEIKSKDSSAKWENGAAQNAENSKQSRPPIYYIY
ncbi:hypothetical protein [Mesomycoplasma conjunctivae]|uniref:hypothetical protein n=1 Tax=Mesomycoplasma conjunctivae TaxID=45361 RepID=UPI003DA6B218